MGRGAGRLMKERPAGLREVQVHLGQHLEQLSRLHRLAQECNRTELECLLAQRFIRRGTEEDDGDLECHHSRVSCELEATHSAETDVEQQATHIDPWHDAQELFGRAEQLRTVTAYAQQSLER